MDIYEHILYINIYVYIYLYIFLHKKFFTGYLLLRFEISSRIETAYLLYKKHHLIVFLIELYLDHSSIMFTLLIICTCSYIHSCQLQNINCIDTA